MVSYVVSPALPAGLVLNPGTGIISGTSTVIVGTAAYTVMATNSGGSTTKTLVITVNDIPPTLLAYSSNPATYANGVTIAPNTPSNSGGAVIVYSVSPPLPAGLSLNAVTGVITGTPTAVVAAANYTVTAQNSGGSTTVAVNLRVVAPPVVTPNPTTTPVLSFNGTSRHVNAGTAIALANQSFTIEFWAKRGAIGALHTAINQGVTGAGTDRVLSIGFTAANTFSFGFSADDLVTTTTYTDTAAWHHWACTFDASSRDRRIYFDGLLVKSGTAAPPRRTMPWPTPTPAR